MKKITMTLVLLLSSGLVWAYTPLHPIDDLHVTIINNSTHDFIPGEITWAEKAGDSKINPAPAGKTTEDALVINAIYSELTPLDETYENDLQVAEYSGTFSYVDARHHSNVCTFKFSFSHENPEASWWHNLWHRGAYMISLVGDSSHCSVDNSRQPTDCFWNHEGPIWNPVITIN